MDLAYREDEDGIPLERFIVANPFPGMNPYLETHWGDVHARLIIYTSDQLRPCLPGDLLARVEERVFVESVFGPERSLVPDVRVVERRGGKKPSSPAPGTLVLAEPLIVSLDEPTTQSFIEIREAGSGRRLVTVIEFPEPGQQESGRRTG